MIRPLTCLSLAAALGAGLYLYQEKHRAQLLDREIGRVVHQADQARSRIELMKAEWALLNEPERLGGLANAHLQLQNLAPAQYARMEDLKSRLPPISLAPPADEPPMALVTPPAATAPARPAAPSAVAPPAVVLSLAALSPLAPLAATAADTSPAAVAHPASLPRPPVVVASAHPAAAAPKPAAPHVLAAAKPREREPEAPVVAAAPRPVFAPVMPAYVPTPVVIYAPTVQNASAIAQPLPAPFVGSALGMARTTLPAPVPVASSLGYLGAR